MLKLFSVSWEVTTAGPSPDWNKRTEVFLFGCKRAAAGNPCKGCFNSPLWDSSVATIEHDPKEVAKTINQFAPNKYVTIGGGEPTDQIDDLVELCKELKKYGFHIMVYTWRELRNVFDRNAMGEANFTSQFRKLLNYVDMIADGSFILEQSMYNENSEDGTFSSVGSGNQIIWDVKGYREAIWPSCFPSLAYMTGYELKDVDALYLKPKNNDLLYILKEDKEPIKLTI